MITSEIAVAYTQCKLKAYLLLFTNKKGTTHEHISIIEEETRKNRAGYFKKIKMETPEAEAYYSGAMKKGTLILFEANLSFNDLEAYTDSLDRVEEVSS